MTETSRNDRGTNREVVAGPASSGIAWLRRSRNLLRNGPAPNRQSVRTFSQPPSFPPRCLAAENTRARATVLWRSYHSMEANVGICWLPTVL